MHLKLSVIHDAPTFTCTYIIDLHDSWYNIPVIFLFVIAEESTAAKE